MPKYVVPLNSDYVMQAHVISRAAHKMPVMLRRLVYLVMAQVRPGDAEFMEIEMTVGDIARALDMGDHGIVYERIRNSVIDGLKQVLEIKLPNGGWKAYQWLSLASYNPEKDTMQIRLHDELRPYVLEMQRAFKSIAIRDIARLQGRYSLRIFELVMSRIDQANEKGYWFYEITIDEIRTLFKIGPNEYSRTEALRRRTIDEPIEEINASGLGLNIRVDYIRRGRTLYSVKLNCQKMERGTPKPAIAPTSLEEKEEIFIEAHKERFFELLRAEQEQLALPGTEHFSVEMRVIRNRAEALKNLKKELLLKKKK
jgi:hypothetical protein